MTDDYIAKIEACKVFTIVISIISTLFPLSVVMILLQRYNRLVRGKSLIHYILCIAVADTLNAIFYAFGYPTSQSITCDIQGFFVVFFSRMSWFFTDILIFQLFFVVVYKRYFLNKQKIHAIVFLLNTALALIPFSTNTTYGLDDDGIPFGLCGYFGTWDSEWSNYGYNVEALVSFIFIIIFTAIIIVFSLNDKNFKSSNIYINERMIDSWKTVILYPIAMLISWIPSIAYSFYFNTYIIKHGVKPPNGELVLNYLTALNVLYGPLLAFIFYTKTLDARRAWLQNFKNISSLIFKVEIDDRRSCDSILSIDDFRMTEIELKSIDSSQYQENPITIVRISVATEV